MSVSSASILIMEDQLDIRIYLVNLLHAHGYQTIAVTSAKEGLDIIRQSPPALVILDIMLPGDEANRVYMTLRCEEKTARIPVIFLSPISRRTWWTPRICGSGAKHKPLAEPDAILTKPPEAEDFLEAVRRLI